ncbi:MAG: ATP-binding protein [Oscillospiraceae bacterium]
MTKRIFRSILLGTLAVLLASTLLVLGVLYSYFASRLETELQSQTQYIAHGVATEGGDYFTDLPGGGSRITWVAADGTVLYDSRENAARLSNHGDREEIQEALETGTGQATRYSDTVGTETVYYAQRLPDGTVLRVSALRYTVWVLLLQALQPMALVLLAAIGLAFFLASRLSRQIVRPINALDLQHPEEADCYDELSPLLGKVRSQNLLIARQMAELRRRQEEFAALTENMSEGFLVIDRQTRVLSHNAAALRLLDARLSEEEPSVFALNRGEAFRRAVEEALSGRRGEQLLERDGRCCQILASPVYEGGDLTGAVLLLWDVTEREQRESLRREFTANVSHELKTPLTSILGTAEILENGMVQPADIAHFAGNIRQEAQRLIALVGDIIKLSRLDETDVPAEREPVELLSLAHRVVEQLQAAAAEKRLTMEVTGDGATVWGVPAILEEMVYNLCDNAIAYNREGGRVTLAVTTADGEPRLTVTDTGIGIPESQQTRVFERFYRVEKSHAGRGTGLGLSIVKHGAAFHGGTVTLGSRPGEGTAVTLQFPGTLPRQG